jgi:integrase
MLLSVNATRGLQLPAYDETPRDRVATPDEAKGLLEALKHQKCHPCDRVSYGLALYAGLRNVERLPLGWEHICLNTNVIRIRTTKGEGGAGIRTLPIVAPLRAILLEEWDRQGQPSKGLICRGPKGGAPEYNSMVNRACQAWEAAKLEAIGLHECRHTFITTMIAAGLNAKAVSVLAGHASIDVTFDRYGHLFPGSEDEAGSKLNAYYEPNHNVVPIRRVA